MKKQLIIMALLSVMSVGLAQEKNEKVNEKPKREMLTPDEAAKREADKMAKELSLDEAQRKAWQNAVVERINANKPIREKMKGSTTPEERKALRTEMRENHKKFREKTEALLNPEQKKTYENWKKTKREERKGKHGPYKGKHAPPHKKEHVK